MHRDLDNFNQSYYLWSNPDLKENLNLCEHWINHGSKEGRSFCYNKDLTLKPKFNIKTLNRNFSETGNMWVNFEDLTNLKNPYYFDLSIHEREYLPKTYFCCLYNYFYEDEIFIPNIPKKEDMKMLMENLYTNFNNFITNNNKSTIVALSHRGGGGTEKYLYYNLEQEYPDSNIFVLKPIKGNCYILHSITGRKWNMTSETYTHDIEIPFYLPTHFLCLKKILKLLNTKKLFLNHMGSWGNEISEIVKWYSYDMMVHDYCYISKNPNPLYHEFSDCLDQFDVNIDYFKICRDLILNADKVSLPSNFLKNIYQTKVNREYTLKPHKENFPLHKEVILRPFIKNFRILVVGEFSERKGLYLIKEIIKNNVDFEFHLLGINSELLSEYPNTICYGRYDDRNILEIISLISPHFCLYCSIFHETFCYTLSYSLNNKIPIISTNVGSIPERTEGRYFTWIFKPQEIVAKFRQSALLIREYSKYMHSLELKENMFDWKFYLSVNSDLVENGILTREKAWKHFTTFGYKENRYGSFKKWSYEYHYSESNYDGNSEKFWDWKKRGKHENEMFLYKENKWIEDDISSFDYKKYKAENSDIKLFSKKKLWNHWINYGKYEFRKFPFNDKKIRMHKNSKVSVINFPQFHEEQINNKVWFKGWTDFSWLMNMEGIIEGVDLIKPDGGVYDYSEIEPRKKDTALFKKYNIDMMVYYHYWFNGKIILNKPLENMLLDGHPDTPFVLCWANETWSKRWDINNSKEIIVDQSYSQEKWADHVKYLCQFFSHPNYHKINNKPYFIIAISNELMGTGEGLKMLKFYNDEVKKYGFDGIMYIQLMNLYDKSNGFYEISKTERQPDFLNNVWCQDPNYTHYMYDKIKEKAKIMSEYDEEKYLFFNPDIAEAITKGNLVNGKQHYDIISREEKISRSVRINLYNCEEVWKNIALSAPLIETVENWFGTYAGWNNCPRIFGCEEYLQRSIPSRPNVHINFSPYGFYRSLVKTMQKYDYLKVLDPVILINAWNEWGEGNCVQPSDIYGEDLCLAIKLAKENFIQVGETYNLKKHKLIIIDSMQDVEVSPEYLFLSKVNSNIYKISKAEFCEELGVKINHAELFYYLPEEVSSVVSFINQYCESIDTHYTDKNIQEVLKYL